MYTLLLRGLIENDLVLVDKTKTLVDSPEKKYIAESQNVVFLLKWRKSVQRPVTNLPASGGLQI